MPEHVTGPAFYFPSIEKKYGKPVNHGHGHATALVGYALVQRVTGAGQQACPQPEGTRSA